MRISADRIKVVQDEVINLLNHLTGGKYKGDNGRYFKGETGGIVWRSIYALNPGDFYKISTLGERQNIETFDCLCEIRDILRLISESNG